MFVKNYVFFNLILITRQEKYFKLIEITIDIHENNILFGIPNIVLSVNTISTGI